MNTETKQWGFFLLGLLYNSSFRTKSVRKRNVTKLIYCIVGHLITYSIAPIERTPGQQPRISRIQSHPSNLSFFLTDLKAVFPPKNMYKKGIISW